MASLPIKVTPTARTEVLSVTSVAAGGNVGIYSATFPFQAQPPATPQADGDLTGDGVPDLTVPGGPVTGLAPGLWLAQGQAGSGRASGDGTLNGTLADIGPEGNGMASDYSPADFTGGQVTTGLFDNHGFQDTLTYYPPGTATHGGSYAGKGVILLGNGDGTATSDQDFYTNGADSSDTVEVQGLDVFDGEDKGASNIKNPTSDLPLQVANGYHAQTPATSTVNVTTPLPDLITINGDPNTSTTTNVMPNTNGNQLGYYLEYYPNGSDPGLYGAGSVILNTTCTPDSTSSTCSMDWNDWRITTMAEPASTAYPYGAVDMFLYKPATGALYLWQNLVIIPDPNGLTQFGTASATSYLLTPSGSSTWQSPGTTFAELRAANINGSGPALWAVTSTGQVTPWFATITDGTATIAAGTTQSLLSPGHAWRLSDGTDDTTAVGTTNTGNSTDVSPPAADSGTDASTGMQLTAPSATANATWSNQGGLFNPALDLNDPAVTDTTKNPGTIITGSTGYVTETTNGPINDDNDYTISAWVKPSTLGGAILSQAGSSTSCYMLYIDTTTISGTTYGRWNFRLSNANTSSPTWYTATSGDTHYVKLSAWTHLTVTYFNGTDPATGSQVEFLRLYVNGIPAAVLTSPTTWAGGCNTFSLGRYIDGGGATHGIFQGEIADVQAWAGTTLTPTEVADISGTPGYTLFPSDGTVYTSAPTSTTWQWTTQCGEMKFYQGQIKIQQLCTGTGSATFGPGGITSGSRLELQGDGNLVIYGSTAVWNTGTPHNPDDTMFFQPDGNLVIYGPYGESLWGSGTSNAPIYN